MNHFVWDISPTLLEFGPIQIRYYGLLFAAVILLGFHFMQKFLKGKGYGENEIYPAFYLITILAIIGARVGHCFFYEPERYLADPIEILYIWKGGLASHGGTIGIITGSVVYALWYRIPYLYIADSLSFASAIASTFVRVGNFFNSEIIGRATDLPWAVRFPRSWDRGQLARHPSQLYEAAMGLTVFLVIYFVNKKYKGNPPSGLLSGLFLTLYFLGRFMVEFVKEYQTLSSHSALTMGQYLSIPFFLLGLVFLFFAWKDAKQRKA